MEMAAKQDAEDETVGAQIAQLNPQSPIEEGNKNLLIDSPHDMLEDSSSEHVSLQCAYVSSAQQKRGRNSSRSSTET